MGAASRNKGARLPPYGRHIRDARSVGNVGDWWGASIDGRAPSIWLCVGPYAWEAARDWSPHRLVTLLPPGEDPTTYDWTILTGADPLLLWRCGDVNGDHLEALLKAVTADGTDRVLDLSTGIRYVAEVRSAAVA